MVTSFFVQRSAIGRRPVHLVLVASARSGPVNRRESDVDAAAGRRHRQPDGQRGRRHAEQRA